METDVLTEQLTNEAIDGAIGKLSGMVEGFGAALPKIAIAIIVFLVF